LTTIAYRDGWLAADTMGTDGHGCGWGRVVKIARMGPILAAAAGQACLCRGFLDWFRAGMRGCPELGDKDLNADGMLFLPDGAIIEMSPLGAKTVEASFYSTGSGMDYALGAMAMGATAEAAVRIAAQFDTCTGGDITVLRHEG
jgi:hypothetical protein